MYILFHNEKAYYINIVVIGSDDNRRKTKVQNRIVGIQWNHILLTTKKGVVKNKLLLPTNQGMGIGGISISTQVPSGGYYTELEERLYG